MAQYVVLGNYTERALNDLKTAVKMGEATEAAIGAMGGTAIWAGTTFGQYDFVVVVEMPGDEAMLELALRAASSGMFKTQVLKAFPDEQVFPILEKL